MADPIVQKHAVMDVMDMIRSGNVDNQTMIDYLMKHDFTREEAIYTLGYLKDHKEDFVR